MATLALDNVFKRFGKNKPLIQVTRGPSQYQVVMKFDPKDERPEPFGDRVRRADFGGLHLVLGRHLVGLDRLEVENELAKGVSLGAVGAEFMSADWGEMRVKGNFLLLSFNREHLLTSAARSEWDNYGGGGKGIQPLFGFVSVVDAGDLTHSMPQHRWGGALLQRRLPVALNRDSDPDSGQSGLQQRGTPKAVGQQSLELD